MWRLDRTRAQLQTPNLNCEVDLLRPAAGLLNLSVQTGPERLPFSHGNILQIYTGIAETPATLLDAYVRGTDLVATYRETPQRPVCPQIYWRALPASAETVGLELLLSVQTEKLDGRAAIGISGELTGDVTRQRDGVYAFPLAGGRVYVELVHPSNLASTALEADSEHPDHCYLRHRFFPGSLEKGVIHRAMVRALFARSDDPAVAERLYQRFLDAAPPLTT